jgi:hypothetical protein
MPPSNRMMATPRPIHSASAARSGPRSMTPVTGPSTKPDAIRTTIAGSRRRQASHWLASPTPRIVSIIVAPSTRPAYASDRATPAVWVDRGR